MTQRTALLIRCKPEDAAQIHHYAAMERRPVSGYVLNVLDRILKVEDALWQKLGRMHFQALNRMPPRSRARRGATTPKTTILIRCSREEARRIRTAAERRETTISAFVTASLQRFWDLAKGRPTP